MLLNKIINKLRGIYLDVYFNFNNKILFKDKYGLSYYLYKNTRPKDTFNIGVRTDDTTVLYAIEKILSSSNTTNSDSIHCFDIGSFIGVITLMMSKTLQKNKKEWKIHSFEPFQESFLRLQKNINLDAFNNNIILNNLAVSDTSGKKTLKAYPGTPGQNHIDISTLQNNDNIYHENVKVITLRDYMYENNIKHINICKIDTEGSDELVIKGLYEYLKNKAINYFIFEYDNNLSYERIKHILSANDYTIYYMVRNENVIINSLEDYPINSKSLLNLIAVSSNEKVNFKKEFNLSY
jgi:FkbM family methyltransferase